MTTSISQDERDELHRRRNEEQMRIALTEAGERAICRQWAIEYSANGTHWPEIVKRRNAVDRLMRDQERADERKSQVGKSFFSEAGKAIWYALWGAAALGLGYLGIKVGGGGH